MMKKLNILVSVTNLNNMHSSEWTVIETQNYQDFIEDYSEVCTKIRLREEKTRFGRGLWGS
jgi:hypothetical protein